MPEPELWRKSVAERLEWMRTRREIEVMANDTECWEHHETHGHRYRYLAPSDEYGTMEPAYPTQWYYECGCATDPVGSPADA